MSFMCPTTNNTLVFNPTSIETQPFVPKEFIWSCGHLSGNTNNENVEEDDELNEPLVDLDGFFRGDEDAIKHNAGVVKKACFKHGFFQVMNHGVDASLIQAAHDEMERLFKLPWEKKLSVQRKAGSMSGYSGAHCDRFSKELPWKETFSFGYHYLDATHDLATYKPLVVDYFNSVFGKEFEPTGWVYQRYCEAMKQLSYVIFEMLAISLGVERLYFKKFFQDGNSIMRCNSYPPCKEPGLTFGTGPHCDPTSLTILHQDDVGGLQVFADSKWQAVRPRPDAFVINIGDTFMALCNGRYKSCMHRVLVNKEKERRSLVFFVNPREDKVVRPPLELMIELDTTTIKDQHQENNNEQVMIMNGKNSKLLSRKYPDFKWHHLLEFTQNHHRADASTLQRFFQWLPSSNLA